MLTLPQIIEALKDRRVTVVAEALGMRPNTVIDIAKGRVENPSYATVKALSDYLAPADHAA